MVFCTDVDLLNWEPDLFRDAVFASQLQASGTGDLDGTSFTIDGGADAGEIAPGQVIVLEGPLGGCYPIVARQSTSQLTISVMYPGLDAVPPTAAPVGRAVDVPFAIRTFYPQRRTVSELLKATAGVAPGQAIVNAEAMRRPCVLGTLQMIYNALAAGSTQPTPLAVRAELYERLYRRALMHLRVEIDTDGDGQANVTRQAGVVQLYRS